MTCNVQFYGKEKRNFGDTQHGAAAGTHSAGCPFETHLTTCNPFWPPYPAAFCLTKVRADSTVQLSSAGPRLLVTIKTQQQVLGELVTSLHFEISDGERSKIKHRVQWRPSWRGRRYQDWGERLCAEWNPQPIKKSEVSVYRLELLLLNHQFFRHFLMKGA